MISINSVLIVTSTIFLVSQVAAYRGWGSPACPGFDAVSIQESDCVQALHQFFETSEVYTHVKGSDPFNVESYGTCSVGLSAGEGCKVREEYLRSPQSDLLEKMGGTRGGMDLLMQKCITGKQRPGTVKIPEDPTFDRPTPLACNFDVKITQYA
ncbi:secreted protein [Melampsora americana]|nr:secreted protein [Melampsora americana]